MTLGVWAHADDILGWDEWDDGVGVGVGVRVDGDGPVLLHKSCLPTGGLTQGEEKV